MTKSPLYTRTGDNGTTSLVGGERVAKDSLRLEAYGTVDELNSHIGLLRAEATDPDTIRTLQTVQNLLFDIGGYLASDPEGTWTLPPGVAPHDIEAIEKAIDSLDGQLPKLNSFVLPGGSPQAAHAHIARTVCRRAERRIIALSRQAPVAPEVIRYINRLSDYFFALARFCNTSQNIDEIIWQKNC